MVASENPPDATHFPIENENAIASKSGDPPSPKRRLAPARELLIHCWCPIAGAGAGVECGWKPGGWPEAMTYDHIISGGVIRRAQ